MKTEQKWEALRNHLVEGAEAGEKYEAEKTIRTTLEKMKELDLAVLDK